MNVDKTTPAAVLEGKALTKQFYRKSRNSAQYFDAVSNADIALYPGELVVLMGRSGSGKTTLLNMLAGLLQPTSGTVSFRGQDIYALSDAELSRLRNKNFGVVPQGQTPLYSLTVRQNITLAAEMYGKDAGADDRADELLQSFGIADLADSYPQELSGGELRRMAISRALVTRPAVVLADEPTSDLDDENTAMVLTALRGAAEQGCAVLIATHDATALEYGTRTLHMNAGVLTEVGEQQ